MLADEQTAGRGRHGRGWHAPPGTSLMCSLLLRPEVDATALPLLGLLAGLTLAEVCETIVSGVQFSLKWPNDLLADGRKCAGVLAEAVGDGAVVLGAGLNVDWRGVARPDALAGATSLSEVGRRPVDRWRVLTALIDRLDSRYAVWREAPRAFLPAYRERSATLGQRVRVTQLSGRVLQGVATGIGDDGALGIDVDGRVETVHAGDVEHLRPL